MSRRPCSQNQMEEEKVDCDPKTEDSLPGNVSLGRSSVPLSEVLSMG